MGGGTSSRLNERLMEVGSKTDKYDRMDAILRTQLFLKFSRRPIRSSYGVAMKSFASILAAIGLAAFMASEPAASINLRIITYNIRYATTSPSSGEQPWTARRPKMYSQLNFETAGRPESVLCFQEVLHQQLQDLQADLGPTWAHIGVGRDDGKTAGEYSPMFYQPTTWTLQRNRTYWLSTTPDVPSKGWDAALPRIATVGQFRHASTGDLIVLMCTHFDNAGQIARENSARLLVNLAAQWEEPGSTDSAAKTPVFLAGDLNSEPSNAAYKTFVAAGALRDVKDLVPVKNRHGNTKTYTAFTTSTSDDTQLDHIFVKDPTNITFLSYAVLPNRFDDDPVFISDHRAVVTDLQLSVP
jgi:endonuclease/exonuclease/phosphatase family metal-dependent hydrolase